MILQRRWLYNMNLHRKPLWKYDLTKCTSQQPSFEAIGQNEADRGI